MTSRTRLISLSRIPVEVLFQIRMYYAVDMFRCACMHAFMERKHMHVHVHVCMPLTPVRWTRHLSLWSTASSK